MFSRCSIIAKCLGNGILSENMLETVHLSGAQPPDLKFQGSSSAKVVATGLIDLKVSFFRR